MKAMYDSLKSLAVAAVLCATSGCSMVSSSSSSGTSDTLAVERQFVPQKDPGAVEYVWEEPMTDVITVPPGLDPEGHYYRPAHQSVVEIRQGRWRYHKAK